MELVIEFGEDGRAGYGSFHRRGCADVSDPELIGTASTPAEAVTLADQATSRASNDGEKSADYGYKIASCVNLPAG